MNPVELLDTDNLLARVKCPICGDAVDAQPWTCSRCSTPHHCDCAEYFGGCAIYGCRDGQVPDRMETRTWPKAISRLKTFARIRRLQCITLIACLAGIPLVYLGFVLEFVFRYSNIPNLLAFAGMGTLVLGGPTYILLNAIASKTWSHLLDELGADRSSKLEIPRSRLRFALPDVARTETRFSVLRVVGALMLIFAVALASLFFLFPPIQLSIWTAFAGSVVAGIIPALGGAMMFVGGAQIVEHRQELEQFLHRFEATYAPALLEKSGKEEGDEPTVIT